MPRFVGTEARRTYDVADGEPMQARHFDGGGAARAVRRAGAARWRGGGAAGGQRAGPGVRQGTYRHCKAILATGEAQDVLASAGLPAALPDGTEDPGVVRGKAGEARLLDRFVAAVAAHRVYARETDPPAV